jgi:hypothetical protein
MQMCHDAHTRPITRRLRLDWSPKETALHLNRFHRPDGNLIKLNPRLCRGTTIAIVVNIPKF